MIPWGSRLSGFEACIILILPPCMEYCTTLYFVSITIMYGILHYTTLYQYYLDVWNTGYIPRNMLAAEPQYMNHGRAHYVFTPRTLTRILAVFPDMPRLLTLFHFNCRYFSLYLHIFTGSSVSSGQTRYNAFRVI